jgi:hypothetical protein
MHQLEMAVGDEALGLLAHGLRQHGAQHMIDRAQVVIGHPVRELDQHRGEHRIATALQAGDLLQAMAMAAAGHQFQHHARHQLSLQRHLHPAADAHLFDQVGRHGVVQLEGGGTFQLHTRHSLGRS